MHSVSSTESQRQALLDLLFPQGVPVLWCPPLTHYDAHGVLDKQRIAAHWQWMATWTQGMLVPGSTGDGWELTAEETRQLIETATELALRFKMHLLLGALRPTAHATCQAVEDVLAWLKACSGAADGSLAMRQMGVCAFTICAPRGRHVTRGEMREALARILDMGLPLALYQLPQITQNELAPDLIAELANQYSNLILFKDTSGRDATTSSGLNLRGLITLRGMEGDYARWFKAGGGNYDGFLLSTANGLGHPLQEIIRLLSAGQTAPGQQISERLTALVNELFACVIALPDGNKYTNAAKAVDHFFAYGTGALARTPPRLHSGRHLTHEILQQAGALLRKYGWFPGQGYL